MQFWGRRGGWPACPSPWPEHGPLKKVTGTMVLTEQLAASWPGELMDQEHSAEGRGHGQGHGLDERVLGGGSHGKHWQQGREKPLASLCRVVCVFGPVAGSRDLALPFPRSRRALIGEQPQQGPLWALRAFGRNQRQHRPWGHPRDHGAEKFAEVCSGAQRN